jgi:hypothetical protein
VNEGDRGAVELFPQFAALCSTPSRGCGDIDGCVFVVVVAAAADTRRPPSLSWRLGAGDDETNFVVVAVPAEGSGGTSLAAGGCGGSSFAAGKRNAAAGAPSGAGSGDAESTSADAVAAPAESFGAGGCGGGPSFAASERNGSGAAKSFSGGAPAPVAALAPLLLPSLPTSRTVEGRGPLLPPGAEVSSFNSNDILLDGSSADGGRLERGGEDMAMSGADAVGVLGDGRGGKLAGRRCTSGGRRNTVWRHKGLPSSSTHARIQVPPFGAEPFAIFGSPGQGNPEPYCFVIRHIYTLVNNFLLID